MAVLFGATRSAKPADPAMVRISDPNSDRPITSLNGTPEIFPVAEAIEVLADTPASNDASSAKNSTPADTSANPACEAPDLTDAIEIESDGELEETRFRGMSIEEILIKLGAKPAYVREALKRRDETNEPLPIIVRDMSLISQEMVAKAIAYNAGYRYFGAEEAKTLDLEVVRKIQDIIEGLEKFTYSSFIPVGIRGGRLEIAVDAKEKVNEARNTFIDHNPVIVLASAQTILYTYRKYFARTEEAFKKAVGNYVQAHQKSQLGEQPGLVFTLIGALLRHACYAGASDVFLWQTKRVGQVAMKIDGKGSIFSALRIEVYDAVMELLITSCGLSESIKAGPQEAKVEFNGASAEIRKEFEDVFGRFHFRMEAVYGPDGRKNVVIRVNDGQSTEADFSALPFDDASRALIQASVTAPTGLILVTGPTGSGKTTTLYSVLREIDPILRRIFSVENPIEYRHGMWIQHELPRPKEVAGKKQSEGEIGREYLKALLREAPDVILWGEVRDDPELVTTLLAAANTGHLVFTSLHTNSAPKAVLRLLELGANREALAGVLRLVIAQRLVARLCDDCKVVDDRMSTTALLAENSVRSATPYRAVGCTHCGHTGYRGRRMIYEVMAASKVRSLIEEGASISKIEKEGLAKTETIWYRGLELVADGTTSIDELLIRADRGE